MSRLALFAGTLAIGSWIGLGTPMPGHGRASVAEAAEAKARPGAETPEASSSQAAAGPEIRGSDLGDIPSLRAWPELNPTANPSRAWMVAEGPAYAAGTGRRLVTLTFDDGPFPETTPAVLRVLAKYDVRAAFFVIGRYLDGESVRAKASREVLKQVAAAGHLIGNHTHDHAQLTAVTHTQVLEQIDRGAASIERVTGKRPVLFRPPYGKLDEFGQAAVRERGLDLLLWSIEKQDMKRDDSHQVFRELAGQIDYKDGGVVLLHDVRWTSIAALRELLAWLHLHRWDPKRPSRVGYEIVDLPTYLREVAASPLPYATRDDLERAREAASRGRGTSRPVTISRQQAEDRVGRTRRGLAAGASTAVD